MDLGWLPMAVLWSIAAAVCWLRDYDRATVPCGVLALLGWILVVWG